MTFALSIGHYGGFYITGNSITKRICLGWIALTWVGIEIDDLMRAYADAPPA